MPKGDGGEGPLLNTFHSCSSYFCPFRHPSSSPPPWSLQPSTISTAIVPFINRQLELQRHPTRGGGRANGVCLFAASSPAFHVILQSSEGGGGWLNDARRLLTMDGRKRRTERKRETARGNGDKRRVCRILVSRRHYICCCYCSGSRYSYY